MVVKGMKKHFCMYCGYAGGLMDFRYIMKKGTYSRKMFKCPNCEAMITKRVLTVDFTPSEWAKYLYYGIKFYGEEYFVKIQFEDLKITLKKYGIANQFWESWKHEKEVNKLMGKKWYIDEIDKIVDSKTAYKKIKQGKLINVQHVSRN